MNRKSYNIPTYSFGGVLSGGASGAVAGAKYGPWGAVAGGALGTIGGIFKQKAQEDAINAQKLKQIQDSNTQRELTNRYKDQSTIASYGMYGTSDYSFFAKGGLINPNSYEVENNEVVQGEDVTLEGQQKLSSDMTLAKGATHENGGVDGVGGERVFSDRIPVDSSIRDLISSLNIGKVKGKTYADVAKSLGDKKGKFEKKLTSNQNPSINTANRMLDRIDGSLDILFDFQEESKNNSQENQPEEFAWGGTLGYNNPYELNPMINPNAVSTPNRPIYTDGVSALDGMIPSGVNANLNFSTPQVLDANISASVPATEKTTGGGFDAGSLLKNNAGQIANLANYLGNENSIDSLNTTVNRNLYTAPTYNYRDRSGTPRQEIGRAVRQGINSLESSSATVNAANAGAIVTRAMDATNDISANENQRRDAYDENFNDRAFRTNMANVDIINKASDDKRDLENGQTQARQQNRTSFTQGVIANLDNRERRETDKTKMALSALVNDNNGVLTRLSSKYNTDINGLIKLISNNRLVR